ncbi:MAG TPA: DUF1508 domain-containing protein [Gemmatales bacterium]|nr:DUF1508 domain-containing protein [Gemmatales bacterium]
MLSSFRKLSGLIVLALLSTATVHAALADALKFEIYQDAKKEYRWRLKNADDKVLATAGQGFTTKKSCEESVDRIKNNVTSDKVKIEYYEDNKKQTRWRMIASNGQNVASSPVGYATKAECEKAYETVKKEVKNAKVEVIPDPK